jgi:glycerol-3-phosphate acyltransferase PlsY
MTIVQTAAVVIVAYLIGSIPTGYLAGRLWRGIDIRDYGSGMVGATNVLRTLGRGPFIVVLFADALKGYIPTLAAWYLFQDEGVTTAHAYQVAAGIAAVIGHDFPIFIGFRGGRGVATSFGVFAALAMPLAVSLVAVGLFIVLAIRYMSVMSLITVPLGAIVLFTLALIPGGDVYTWTKVIFGVFATVIVFATHIPNIRRLMSGTEPKIGEGGGARAEAVRR